MIKFLSIFTTYSILQLNWSIHSLLDRFRTNYDPAIIKRLVYFTFTIIRFNLLCLSINTSIDRHRMIIIIASILFIIIMLLSRSFFIFIFRFLFLFLFSICLSTLTKEIIKHKISIGVFTFVWLED